MVVVYHSRKQQQVCEQLISFIKTLEPLQQRIKLYAFSPEKDTLAEDFAEVSESIEAIPLPEAIYNAYRATFKTLKLDRKILSQPITTNSTETTLFDSPSEA